MAVRRPTGRRRPDPRLRRAWLAAAALAGCAVIAVALGAVLRGREAPPAAAEAPIRRPAAVSVGGEATAPGRAVSGAPVVVDTATLDIQGRRIVLDGIVGMSGRAATELGLFISEQGGRVSCQPRGAGAHVCTTSNGYDLAAAALVNGAARASASAGPQYRELEAEARRERRGIWE